MLSKLYTTDSSNKDESTPEDLQPHFEENKAKEQEDLDLWELESSKDRSATSRVAPRHAHQSKHVRDFADMLDSMIKDRIKKPDSRPKKDTEHLSSASGTAMAQSIVGLVKNQAVIHKQRKPLPKSAAGSIYSGIAQPSLFNRQEPEEPEQDPLLEHLSPMSEDDFNWDQTVVLKNERIAAKQEEMEATQAIVEAPSTLDLWHHIENEINRDTYPKYYPAVLTKAIEHASKTDPYMALTIFEKAKQKSVVSYISGCTVQVYNAMLLLRWDVWRDINGMLDLAEEMTVNGIEFDNQSRRIVRAVVREVESEGGSGSGGYLDPQEDAYDGVFWNADEKRSCNLLKELAGKWMISE